MRIAHVLNNKAHYIFDSPSIPLVPDNPEGEDQIFALLVPTNAKEGWLYNSMTGAFSEPPPYTPPPLPDYPTQRQEFFSNGSFKVPAGVNRIWLTACGGGGGGGAYEPGSSGASAGGGGGGAASVYKAPYAVSPGQILSIAIGTGGQGFRTVAFNDTPIPALSGAATVISSLLTLYGGGAAGTGAAGSSGGAGGGAGGLAGGTTYSFGKNGSVGSGGGWSAPNSYQGGGGGGSLGGGGGGDIGGISPISRGGIVGSVSVPGTPGEGVNGGAAWPSNASAGGGGVGAGGGGTVKTGSNSVGGGAGSGGSGYCLIEW